MKTYMKKLWYLTCVALFACAAHSCENPELIDDVSNGINGVDTTTIRINEDLESYMTGKCIMVSFEQQDYSIPYTQLTVDTAFADVDWITVTRYSTYVKVTISENYLPEYRNGYAYYRLKGAEKFDTVIVSQGPRDIFYVENRSNGGGYLLDYKMQEVYFDIFSNVEYTIEIPDSAKEWIQVITPKNTRSYFKESSFGVVVQANEGNYRETYISLKSAKSNERQRIRIAQDGEYFTLDRLVARNPNLSIFYQAIEATGLSETLQKYLDYTYPEIDYEWTEQAWRDHYPGLHCNATAFERDYITVPEKREFKYTLFCMPDTALAAYSDDYWSGGIHNLNELRQYADKVYPEGAGQPDTDKSSSLYKLIAYHILPCWLTYDQFNTRQAEIVQRHLFLKEHDMEDFFETLLPHSIMRISTPYPDGTWRSPLGVYINRRGTQETGLIAEGVRIAEAASEYNLPDDLTNICVNGGYHYINKLLVYDNFTRNTALQCRMRIMCCTLSPDYINSNGRGRLYNYNYYSEYNRMVKEYKPDYCTNVKWIEDQTHIFVRYRDKSFGTYNGDELTIRGAYDFAFKLPPVPADGTYEIRIWNNSMAASGSSYHNYRGIVQFFLHQYNPGSDEDTFWRNWDWIPEGVPVDMRLGGNDPRIGMVPDNDSRYDDMTESERKEAIFKNDRVMRTRGYMKAPDSFTLTSSNDNIGDPIRYNRDCYRYIICSEFLKSDTDYWIRMRQVYDEDAVYPFSFIELVPKSVYDGNEDMH